ncbi:MAG: hypothetical protein C0609_01880 [Deltaproteobacteria bacterium]|nr:MAG: hypothetical protein C0609_01880 [Deltaproteobacteria bacterium]
MKASSYLVLMHYPTVDRAGKVITSAITAIDVHDFSRLARTYGLGGVFVQTNLPKQMELMERLLGHWIGGRGGEANADRKFALECMAFAPTLDDVIAKVEARHGERPIVAMTSARNVGVEVKSFADTRDYLAKSERPFLLLFGTASGLAPEVVEKCDWVIEPIGTPTDYNHLSVRSAASISVDRLFG